MFHVKHSTGWQLTWQDLWDSDKAPYDAGLWQQLTGPWQLLEPARLDEVVAAAIARLGENASKPCPLVGLVAHDCAIAANKVYCTSKHDVTVSGIDKACKGGLRVHVDGESLADAVFVQASAYFDHGHQIFLGGGTFISNGVRLGGRAVIGAACELRHGAYLRGNVVLGNGSIVGHASEMKNVIGHDGCKAPHFNYVGDSILGANVNLGAGTKISNLKITGTEIAIPFDGERLATGTRKLGGILGDDVETGCNSVLNPGCILGRGCRVYPNITVNSGIVGPEQWLKGRKR